MRRPDGIPTGAFGTVSCFEDQPAPQDFLPPYRVNYHAEHHLLMYVPCYNLKSLHRALMLEQQCRPDRSETRIASVLKVAAP